MSALLFSSISSSRPNGDSVPEESILPSGMLPPVLWFSAENVNLDGSNNITSFINKGTSTAVTTATPSSSLATIGDLNGKPIVIIPETSNGGYTFTSVAGIKTGMGLATYGDGTRATFSSYDGYYSGSGNMELTGDSGKNNWYSGQPSNPIKNGIQSSDRVVLPLNRGTIGSRLTGGSSISSLFRDDFNSSRNWFGESGDILFLIMLLLTMNYWPYIIL
ncbi:hypothetical protein SUFG_00042 [Sulfitobacter phage phiCB2047-B]|uniref:Uncharacterized protein n=1 Tax=Sulfitobacter phage phiCB2047-B TaxID=754046 RepID=M4PYH9_9CAUD|nr:hypothetical protein SUFG_00042 [Sulfitobacter phage phiCB2047-B]AGH07409.1 hypothetical protein SUFG_00042 [Sulfitobacter phage phiCB2047-B]